MCIAVDNEYKRPFHPDAIVRIRALDIRKTWSQELQVAENPIDTRAPRLEIGRISHRSGCHNRFRNVLHPVVHNIYVCYNTYGGHLLLCVLRGKRLAANMVRLVMRRLCKIRQLTSIHTCVLPNINDTRTGRPGVGFIRCNSDRVLDNQGRRVDELAETNSTDQCGQKSRNQN